MIISIQSALKPVNVKPLTMVYNTERAGRYNSIGMKYPSIADTMLRQLEITPVRVSTASGEKCHVLQFNDIVEL